MNDNNNQELEIPAAAAEASNYPMDDALISVLGDIDQQMAALNAQWQGALVLFLRQQGLSGNWRVAPNRKELVRVEPGPMGT